MWFEAKPNYLKNLAQSIGNYINNYSMDTSYETAVFTVLLHDHCRWADGLFDEKTMIGPGMDQFYMCMRIL